MLQVKSEHSKSTNSNGKCLKSETESHIPFISLSLLQARAFLFVVSVLSFASSWDGEFVFDDSEAIVGNKDLDPNQPLSDLLIHDFWGKKLTNTSHKSYRPLTVLTFRWNYWLAGGLHPVGFHLVNFLLHGVVSLLLLDFFTLVIHGPCRKLAVSGSRQEMNDGERPPAVLKHQARTRTSPKADPLAFCCSLMFSTHPVHTESVAGLVGRADLLCAVFFILSFLAFVKASTTYQSLRPESFSLHWLLVSACLCGLATFSKEQGITVIGVCCAYDILCICQIDLGDFLGLRKTSSSLSSSQLSSSPSSYSSSYSEPLLHKNGNGASIKGKQSRFSDWFLSFIKRQMFLTVTAAILLVTRWRVMGSAPPTFQVHDNPHSFVNGTLYRAINYNYIYALNAWILVSPHWLCFDWSMGCVPTITSLTDPRILAVFTFWATLGLLAWVCLRGLDRDKARPVILSVVLIVVPFLPATNLLFRVGFVVAERVLYLPSVGFCVLVGLGFQTLCRWSRSCKRVAGPCFLLLLGVMFARSVQRSLHWRNEMSLFLAGEKVCPLNAKVHYNIAKLHGDLGVTEVAVERYRLAIQLNPVYDQAMNNLANILKDQGHLSESEQLLDTAVGISPSFSSAWMNRGITKAALGKYIEAESSYWKAIRVRRNYPDCYYNLGNLYLEMKRHQEALSAFHNATSLKPSHWNAWNNAVILLDNLGHHQQAIKMATEALRHLPDQPNILYSLGNAYGKISDFENSEKTFLRAIRVNPGNSALYQNLGVLYHRWNKYPQALEFYDKAFQMSPDSPNLVDNMNMLRRHMKQNAL